MKHQLNKFSGFFSLLRLIDRFAEKEFVFVILQESRHNFSEAEIKCKAQVDSKRVEFQVSKVFILFPF